MEELVWSRLSSVYGKGADVGIIAGVGGFLAAAGWFSPFSLLAGGGAWLDREDSGENRGLNN